MKRLIIFLCLFFTLSLTACTTPKTDAIIVVPPLTEVNPVPDDDNNSDQEEQPPEIIEPEEENKKKSYVVSKVNGLRVRKNTNGASVILGTLDKGDAVGLLGEQNGYYQTVYKENVAFVHKDYCYIMEVDCSDEKSERAIDLGQTLLGYPYVWGSQRYHWGNGKLNANFVNGEFDCSALVQYVYFLSNEIVLDVNTRTQIYNGVEVQKANLTRGDLMFFTNESRKDKLGVEKIGHVGIYFGNNYILHTASDHAVIEPISNVRWSYYITARRVV